MRSSIWKLMTLALVVGMLGMAFPQPVWAGGAAYPFTQTWTVHWATVEDSLQFAHYIAPGGNVACDAGACELCQLQAWATLIDLHGCARHQTDAAHACADAGLHWEQGGGGHVAEAIAQQEASGCVRHTCVTCVARAAAVKGKVCGHHSGGTAHYCHGKSVTETRMMTGYADHMNPLLLGWARTGSAMTVAEDMEGHARVIELLKAPPRLDATDPGAGAVSREVKTGMRTTPTFTDGRFALIFPDAGVTPIHLQLKDSQNMVLMRLVVRAGKQEFDLRTFPEGTYTIEGWVGLEDRWTCAVTVGTQEPPEAAEWDILPKN